MWLFPWLTYLVIAFIIVSLVVMLFVDQYRPLVLSTGFAALVIVCAGIYVQWHSTRRDKPVSMPLPMPQV
jgi:GABA permease